MTVRPRLRRPRNAEPDGLSPDTVMLLVHCGRGAGELHRFYRNDGRRWCYVVRLLDGRFGAVEASCDYSGWG